MNYNIKHGLMLIYFLLSTLLVGCEYRKDGTPTDVQGSVKPVPAHVMMPEVRAVVDYEEFTGRILPFDEVEVRPQVSGTLTRCTFRNDAQIKINPQTGEVMAQDESVTDESALPQFREGDEVKEGQLLFEIDPQVYQNALDSAKGKLEVLQARRKRLENDMKRAERLHPTGAISAEEYDLALFNLQECDAEIAVAKSEIQKAQINVNYTKIYAPMDGLLCDLEVSVGNLVQANSATSTLVRLVRVDPAYISINIDEATSQMLKRVADERCEKNPGTEPNLEIEFRLSGEPTYTHTAKIDYLTPTLERGTGTRRIRALCENPKTASGERLFQPGMTVHVRIRVTEAYHAILVPEETLGTNQSTRYVYVLKSDNMPEMRTVEIGALQEDNMRVIRSGLKADERIVRDNLLRIRMDRPVEEMK